MDPQRVARVAGVLFLITFVTAIPAQLIFYDSVLNDADYILGADFDTNVSMGALLEMILSGPVPRPMAVLGLVAGPLVTATGAAILFDVFEAGSTWQVPATAPEFIWDLSLGIYLTVKGFKPAPIIAGDAPVAA